ncbi:hypothetical protein DVR14_24885 (plasmid) [Natrinema thermotolerans]|nr:hypothetical protein DVR14_24885 [Natrinema thermotolerans]
MDGFPIVGLVGVVTNVLYPFVPLILGVLWRTIVIMAVAPLVNGGTRLFLDCSAFVTAPIDLYIRRCRGRPADLALIALCSKHIDFGKVVDDLYVFGDLRP